MSQTIYVRCEAVNLGASVYDTEDLSTIRGAGLAILNLSDRLRDICTGLGGTDPKEITSGASQAVIRVTLPDDRDELERFRTDVEEELRRGSQLQFATVLVAVSSADFGVAREELVASIRARQMRSARLSHAGITATVTSREESGTAMRSWCAIDMVRPAKVTPQKIRNDEKRFLSTSVDARRRHGFEAKQAFYKKLDGVQWDPQIDGGYEFAWDFHQIAAFDKATREAAKDGEFSSNLNGKLAVIYIDGNSFGAKQRLHCTDEKSQQNYDTIVQGNWRKAIRRILNAAWSPDRGLDPRWWNAVESEAPRLRLETLLWGGDEVIWVVPAWQGLAVLNTFFHTILDRTGHSATGNGPFGEFTYSAGLVFCHAEAPIRGIVELARELTEFCKDAVNDNKAGPDGVNRFAYAVLESFDQLGDDYHEARNRHLPFSPGTLGDAAVKAAVSNDPSAFADNWPAFVAMRDQFPHGSVYQILRELRQPVPPTPEGGEATFVPRAVRAIDRGLRDAPALANDPAVQRLFLPGSDGKLGDERRMNWLMLAELWDYFGPGPYVDSGRPVGEGSAS